MQSTFYTIYKTTNLVNEKIYIGKHITSNLDDGYMGSGKLLGRAINKYGIENFHKEILHVFDNEADMNAKEAELVTEEFVLQESNYNLCVGGRGGWSYVNREGLNQSQCIEILNHKSEKCRNAMLAQSEELKKARVSKLNRKWHDKLTFAGRKHTTESKAKISVSRKGNNSGEQNSQFGTRWITNGQTAIKIKKTESVPDGWRLGRK
jgi:hypothetical protein